MSTDNRIPPQDIFAEQSVVGAGFLSVDALASAAEVLKLDHFYSPAHRAVFSAQLELYQKNQPVDLITVSDQLRRQGILDQVGGPVYLAELADTVVSSGSAVHHAEIVVEKARRRAMIQISQQLMDTAFDPTVDTRDFAGKAQSVVDSVLEDRVRVSSQLPSEIARAHFERLTLLSKQASAGLQTGWYKYDRMTGGVFPGEVVCIGARPSCGKSVYALNMLERFVEDGAKGGIISLEMQNHSLTNRLYAGRTSIHPSQFRKASFNQEEWIEIQHQAGWMSSLNDRLRMYDRPSISPREFVAQVRKWKRELGGLDWVVIDYLQLMGSDSKGNTREREIAEASRAMKTVALGEGVAVVVLCQLNREVEKRTGKVPLTSDLRESGSIEQDADVVILMEVWDRTNQSAVIPVKFYIGKGRDAQTGSYDLHFFKKNLRFVNPARETGEAPS